MPYKSIKEIRRENFAHIINTQFYKRRAELAEKLDLQVGLISRMMSSKDIGDAMARKIESAAGKEPYWLDNAHDAHELSVEKKYAALDADVLQRALEILAGVEKSRRRHGAEQLSAERKAKLLAAAYEGLISPGANAAEVEKIIKLVA